MPPRRSGYARRGPESGAAAVDEDGLAGHGGGVGGEEQCDLGDFFRGGNAAQRGRLAALLEGLSGQPANRVCTRPGRQGVDADVGRQGAGQGLWSC